MKTARPAAHLLAWTTFDTLAAAELTGWVVGIDAGPDGGEALVEFAGRACYQSWSKPNPATASNAGYLRHILDVGHMSVLEHGTATFYLTGVSRSFTHELVRHRHLSYSQLSQRYVPGDATAMVEPDAIAADPELHKVFAEAANAALASYTTLVERLENRALRRLTHRCLRCGGDGARYPEVGDGFARCPACGTLASTEVEHAKLPTAARKQARQAARAVLPNAAETRIVVTGNYRAWRHFIDMRATEAADVEIREVAILVLRELARHTPHIFGDYVITTLEDGTEVAVSPHAEQS